MDSLVNEDDEWEWYEEEDEQQETNDDSAKNTETTNAETIFAQRRKSSCKVDTMFTFNQVQTKVAEISTSNHNMIPPSTGPGATAEPVWLSTEEMLSLKLEMAKTSANYSVNDADLAKVKVTDQPVILTCAKKRQETIEGKLDFLRILN